MTTDKDIGDYLEVPEEDRLEEDPGAEYNADAGFDIQVIPDGEVVELESAGNEKSVRVQYDDSGDGAPENFISPDDPDYLKADD